MALYPASAEAGPSRHPPAPPHPSRPVPPFLSLILKTHHPRPLQALASPIQLGINPSSYGVSDGDAPGGATKAAPQPLYLPPPAMPEIEEDLVPPENFAVVTSGVYRCGFPKKRNFRFMETLKLKTILTLVLEDYPEANLKWCQANGVQFMQFGIPGNKEPFDNIPEDVITSALCAIMDKRNHPLLIHCNKGKHRTGCLVGCIRRVQSWSLTSIFDEYRRFSNPKSRAVDQQFIDLFDLSLVWDEVDSAKGGGLVNLPLWPMLQIPRASARRPLADGALLAKPKIAQSADPPGPGIDHLAKQDHSPDRLVSVHGVR